MNPTSDDNTAPLAANPVAPTPDGGQKPLVIRIIGVGGAGSNAVAHMANTDLRELRPLALHTSARVLASIQAPEKVLIGNELTHGLGAGGDLSLARAAAEKDAAVLQRLCDGTDLLFIVTGLGRGTGTGVAPILARLAKEAGALVIAVATLPFEIEGPRRQHQAIQGLAELKAAADAVICLPNQKIFRIVDENTTVLESLKITNDLLAQGIRGIWQMLTRPSLLHVDFGDLCAVLRDRHVESSFAAVEAQGEARSRELVEQLLSSPLLDGGQALDQADAILVNLTGGPDLSMADVKRIMEEINRRTDNAQLIISASVADEWRGRVGLTLVASHRTEQGRPPAFPRDRTGTAGHPVVPDQASQEEESSRAGASSNPGVVRFTPSLPEFGLDPAGTRNSRGNGEGKPPKSSRRMQQAHLPLEIVSKGRFEKSQPTIHRGEDLDVPTYIRRGIPLN